MTIGGLGCLHLSAYNKRRQRNIESYNNDNTPRAHAFPIISRRPPLRSGIRMRRVPWVWPRYRDTEREVISSGPVGTGLVKTKRALGEGIHRPRYFVSVLSSCAFCTGTRRARSTGTAAQDRMSTVDLATNNRHPLIQAGNLLSSDHGQAD